MDVTAVLFRLQTVFTLGAPRGAVYEAVREVLDWPRWWRGCEQVTTLASGGSNGVGARHRIVWRSRLPYRVAIDVEVTEVHPGALIRARSQGDLDGQGTWRFTDVPAGTRVQYLWEVETRKRWMRRLAPALAPLFRLNHDWLMRAGAAGLAQRVQAPSPRISNGLAP
jgi:uncharacterized protein YndB with AHSA1/START domain